MANHRQALGDVTGGPTYAMPPVDLTNREIGLLMGVSRSAVANLRNRGLTRYRADEFATRVLGLHPVLVWPEWLDDDTEGVAA